MLLTRKRKEEIKNEKAKKGWTPKRLLWAGTVLFKVYRARLLLVLSVLNTVPQSTADHLRDCLPSEPACDAISDWELGGRKNKG